jgi:hypothetical protein
VNAIWAPCTSNTPRSYRRVSGRDQILLDISFTAGVAATNEHSVFEWAMTASLDASCPDNASSSSATTTVPIRAGQRVVLQQFESRCRGSYSGLVTFQPDGWPGHDTLSPIGSIRDGSLLVGRFSWNWPSPRRSAAWLTVPG